LYGISVVFGLYAFVKTLSGFYVVHLGNGITMIYMCQQKGALSLAYPVVSFAAYALVRTWTKDWEFIATVGSFNVLEQCLGALIMKRTLKFEEDMATTPRFLAVVICIACALSLAVAAPASWVLTQ
jgi:hypothetical protein